MTHSADAIKLSGKSLRVEACPFAPWHSFACPKGYFFLDGECLRHRSFSKVVFTQDRMCENTPHVFSTKEEDTLRKDKEPSTRCLPQ